MRRLYRLLAVFLFVAAGCAQQSVLLPTANAAGAMRQIRSDAGVPVLYSFKGAPDGSIPEAELTVLDGVFYGTTTRGGTSKRSDGTVFEFGATARNAYCTALRIAPMGRPPKRALPS